jgi:hypothetical protein
MRDKTSFGGFFRLQVVEEKSGKKRIVGDSGWKKNMITNAGAQQYIVEKMTGGGSLVSSARLGSGGTVASTLTAIPNEIADTDNSFAVAGAVSASRTLRFTGSLASNVLASTTIGNVGLYAVSTTGAGTMFAGNTFNSSTLATNQAVNLTYDIQFPTT